jgi:VWFA-related protein
MKPISSMIQASLMACLFAIAYLGGVAHQLLIAQTVSPKPSPTPSQPNPPQESIKVYTEEILLPVVATDSTGRFDPTLEVDDLLILEDGVPQIVLSVRRIPASVLLLLDTAGSDNPTMRTNATRDLAVRLVSHLQTHDLIATLQFGGRVELVHGWTEEQDVVIRSLKTKLSSGRRTRLIEGLAAAAAQLRDAPAGNRHVVLVTDGGASLSDLADLGNAVQQLFATQATVHIISYTLMGRKAINKLHPKYGVTITADKRKSAQDISDEIVQPNAPETLDTKLKRKIYLVIENDYWMWRHSRKYAKTLKQNEEWLRWLAEESGGSMRLPNSAEDLPKVPDDLAREIDSQYVVTYTPKARLKPEPAGLIRHVEVISRRVGLYVRSRRTHVAPGFPSSRSELR